MNGLLGYRIDPDKQTVTLVRLQFTKPRGRGRPKGSGNRLRHQAAEMARAFCLVTGLARKQHVPELAGYCEYRNASRDAKRAPCQILRPGAGETIVTRHVFTSATGYPGPEFPLPYLAYIPAHMVRGDGADGAFVWAPGMHAAILMRIDWAADRPIPPGAHILLGAWPTPALVARYTPRGG